MGTLVLVLAGLFFSHVHAQTSPDFRNTEALFKDEAAPLTPEREGLLKSFKTPRLSAAQIAKILSKFPNIDPQHLVPDRLLAAALTYYQTNLNSIPNKGYL